MKYLPFKIFLFILIVGCGSEETGYSSAKIINLDEYETVVSTEDNILGTPKVVRLDESNLYVYDAGKGGIVKLDYNGNVKSTFGRRGRGPGEFQMINNVFLTENDLYAVDLMQYFIHRYNQDGEFISSMDYGRIQDLDNPPPVPFSPSVLRAEDINNKPFVLLNGDVLLPSRQDSNGIYQLLDWQGNKISDIGEIPNGSSSILDMDKYKTAINNDKIPAYHKTNAFPVHDHSNPDNVYLIYSAFPKIMKYSASGQKLWETDIIQTPETDSLINRFYEASKELKGNSRMNLSIYTSGVSSENGDLYLAMISSGNSIWIHQFDNRGSLIRRYKLQSDGIGLMPIFDITPAADHMFVVTETGAIRSYAI